MDNRTKDHEVNCMCDPCIKIRVRDKVARRERDIAQKNYELRRGAPIGGISVSDAIKGNKR